MYCGLSVREDSVHRMSFGSAELAAVFMELVRRRMVHGIFISSGVGFNPDSTMERMIVTAEILRFRYHFTGYIHLKILPGVSFSLIERAAQLANRLSVNLEAPSVGYLKAIAPEKHLREDLVLRMKWAGNVIQNGSFANSQTTQFVVGAAGENDVDILKAVDWVYRECFVFRSYFSAYQPLHGVRTSAAATMLLREHRLYQADFLLRGYGFRLPDIVFDDLGNIPLDVDPKTAFAAIHPELFPVDVNKADESLLLKVPGIGPISASRIVGVRKKAPFHNCAELKSTGARIAAARPYLEFSGKQDLSADDKFEQRLLFESDHTKISFLHSGTEPFGSIELPVADALYDYPGQKQKSLYYSRTRDGGVARCR